VSSTAHGPSDQIELSVTSFAVEWTCDVRVHGLISSPYLTPSDAALANHAKQVRCASSTRRCSIESIRLRVNQPISAVKPDSATSLHVFARVLRQRLKVATSRDWVEYRMDSLMLRPAGWQILERQALVS
jgi:hypothetical protein